MPKYEPRFVTRDGIPRASLSEMPMAACLEHAGVPFSYRTSIWDDHGCIREPDFLIYAANGYHAVSVEVAPGLSGTDQFSQGYLRDWVTKRSGQCTKADWYITMGQRLLLYVVEDVSNEAQLDAIVQKIREHAIEDGGRKLVDLLNAGFGIDWNTRMKVLYTERLEQRRARRSA